MEKILTIGGQDIRFRATMKTLLIYKAQTGREYLADIGKFSGLLRRGEDGKPLLRPDGKPEVNLEVLDTGVLCAIAWAMAKTADDTIPPMEQWLDGFEEFPIMEILSELLRLVNASLKLDAKNA